MSSIDGIAQEKPKHRRARRQWILGVILSLSGPAVFAHGGGLNSEGCHHNRRTGDYHCHRAQPARQPATARFALEEPVDKPLARAARTRADQSRPSPDRHATGPTCHTGPRGGTYTITASGRKNYGGC